jgi:uncharacterized protein
MAPQGRVSDPQSGAMLHAANSLVSLGRARGLRITLITQRPAKLHKDSLSQAETLIALRLIAPQDRRSVEDWIADQADEAKGEEIMASLPSLPTGCGWIWSPEIGILSKVTFPRIKTFDSSNTPEGFADGKNAPVLASIDLATISGRLSSIKEEADANDPAKLKAKIRELQKAVPPPTVKADDKAVGAAFQRGSAAGREYGYAEGVEDATAAVRAGVAKSLEAALTGLTRKAPKRTHSAKAERPTASQRPVPPKVAITAPSGDLSRPEQRIVDSLAFWIGIGKETPTRQQVAAVAGYSPKSSGFCNIIYGMHTKGLVTYPSPGLLNLVDRSSANAMGAQTAKKTLLDTLSDPQRRIVSAFNGTQASRAEIAERSGYSPKSSGYSNLIYSLAGIGVIVYPSTGMVDLADWVRELL